MRIKFHKEIEFFLKKIFLNFSFVDIGESLSIFRILIFFFDKKFMKFVPMKPDPPVINIFFMFISF